MVVRELDYNSSSVLKPRRREQTISSKGAYGEKKKKIEQQRGKKRKDKEIKRDVYQIVFLILVVDGITVNRDAKVYKTQQQLDLLNKEINPVITENEALRVQISKAGSLDKIEGTAKNKLEMILPAKENMIKLGESQVTEGKQ